MNLRDFEYVLAVAEHQHFGRAADACHVSQPTLSGQIRKLEDHLGLEIFERTKRSVKTTPGGQKIVDKARELLAVATSIEELAVAIRDPLSGPLALGAIPTIAPFLMPSLIPSVSRSLPQVDLSVTERFTHDLESLLVDGQLDAAILATEPKSPRLKSIPLYREPFWVALPGKHHLAREEEVHLEDLTSEKLLLLSEGHCLSDQVLTFFQNIRQDNPNSVRTEDTSLTTILALVGGGFGITLVPATSLSGPWVTDAGIAVRKEKSGTASREVRLVFRSSFPRMALIEKLADIIAVTLPDTVAPFRR